MKTVIQALVFAWAVLLMGGATLHEDWVPMLGQALVGLGLLVYLVWEVRHE